MRCVRAIAIYSETIQRRHIQRGGKVAIGCSSHRALSQFKTKLRGNLLCMMKQLDDVVRSLKWSTVNTSCHCKIDTLIKRLKVGHQSFDPSCLVSRVEPHVDFHLSVRRNHIGPRPPTNYANVKAWAPPWRLLPSTSPEGDSICTSLWISWTISSCRRSISARMLASADV